MLATIKVEARSDDDDDDDDDDESDDGLFGASVDTRAASTIGSFTKKFRC
jgi:hypothetical protein